MSSVASALGAVSSQQDMFMKLFLAQIRHQDPEEPMTNAEMVSQLAQLTALDIMNKLNGSFKDILKFQTLLSGTTLIGREVLYTRGGAVVQGKVESLDTTGGSIELVVDGQDVTLDQVTRIF